MPDALLPGSLAIALAGLRFLMQRPNGFCNNTPCKIDSGDLVLVVATASITMANGTSHSWSLVIHDGSAGWRRSHYFKAVT